MIDLTDICLSAGSFRLQNVSLAVAAGEYFILMGRTGSGKSLLLQTICGLLTPASGRVVLDGRDVTHLEPRDRRLGYMPQDTGLFGHLNVWRNVTFSLRVRGLGRAQTRFLAQPLVEMLGLTGLLKRKPKGLSGGEKQKVALARALAYSPKILLLDEPVSALDEPTRADVLAELRRIQRTLNLTVIHVCHSLAEAAIGDRIGVIENGQMQQTGPLAELKAKPATPAVARLMGVNDENAK
jgi:ABC-type sugar transport system ATPase subunit